MDEIFQLKFLVVCQIAKLHATSPRRHEADRTFHGYFNIGNGFKGNLAQREAGASQDDVQFTGFVFVYAGSSIEECQPTSADIYNLAHYGKIGPRGP